MQTILGSGGAFGIELAKALKDYTTDIRLVSRNPQKINDTDSLLSADLLDSTKVFEAVQGSSIVYVSVGFPYNLKVWQHNWPKFIKDVIDACIECKCKLVFFDNIYMYDLNCLNEMNEETTINPQARKVKFVSEVAAMIMNKIKEGQT